MFDAVVRAICGQKVTGEQATAALRGLRRQFGDPAPEPRELRLPPNPEPMARAPYWVYHGLHLEKRRADLLRRVAATAARIDKSRYSPSTEAAAQLVSIQGVGLWALLKTLSISHGDADQVDVGDFHLKHIVVYHLTGRPRGTDGRCWSCFEPFRPHRGRVTRLLHTLGHRPGFGPHVTARDITRS